MYSTSSGVAVASPAGRAVNPTRFHICSKTGVKSEMARLPLSDMLMRKTSSPGEALEAGKGGVPSPVEADQIKGTADDTALLRSSTVPSDTPGMKNRIFCRSPNSKLYASRLHHSQVRLCSGGVF